MVRAPAARRAGQGCRVRATASALPGRCAALAARQDGVVTWAQLQAAGVGEGQVRRLLREGVLVRVRRGAYLLDGSGSSGGVWSEARAVVLTVPGVVLCGSTAARLWGVDLPDAGTVEVASRPGRPLRSRPDLRVHAWTLGPEDVMCVRGMAVTTPARTLVDVVLGSARPDALAALDSGLRKGLVGPGDLTALACTAAGRPGAAHVADLWAWGDGRAESPLESRVRFRCLDAGLPPDDLQVEIRDGQGALLARADMAYRHRSNPSRGLLLVEADGASAHSAPAAVYRDRQRHNRLTGREMDMLRFTYRDTVDRLTIPRAVREAR